MKPKLLFLVSLAVLLLCSCSKNSSSGQHATVLMRDGSSVSGTILSSSNSEVQIAGDDKVTRTIPMPQVRSIEYDAPAPAPADAAAAPPATPAAVPPPAAPPAAAPVAATRPAPVPRPAPAPAPPHQAPYHPTESAITARSHELAAGTQISVRPEATTDSRKATEGRTFPTEVTPHVQAAAGSTVIPRGSNALIVIRSASRGRRIRGASDLVM